MVFFSCVLFKIRVASTALTDLQIRNFDPIIKNSIFAPHEVTICLAVLAFIAVLTYITLIIFLWKWRKSEFSKFVNEEEKEILEEVFLNLYFVENL